MSEQPPAPEHGFTHVDEDTKDHEWPQARAARRRRVHRAVMEVGMRGQRVLVWLLGINLVVVTVLWAQSGRTAAAPAPPGPSDTVRAKALELVDGQGRVRAQLHVEPNGEVVFRLRDPEGRIRVKVGADRDGSGLLLLNASTEPAIHLLAKETGTSLTLANKDGRRQTIAP